MATIHANLDMARGWMDQTKVDNEVQRLWSTRRYDVFGDLTLTEVVESMAFSIYFGTTSRIRSEEAFTVFGRLFGKGPILVRPNGRHFTAKEAEDELGFVCVDLDVYSLNNTACGVEKGLQQKLSGHHGRTIKGVQLHRRAGAGNNKEKKNYDPTKHCTYVFMTVARITAHNFHLPDSDDRRWDMEVNGVQVRIKP